LVNKDPIFRKALKLPLTVPVLQIKQQLILGVIAGLDVPVRPSAPKEVLQLALGGVLHPADNPRLPTPTLPQHNPPRPQALKHRSHQQHGKTGRFRLVDLHRLEVIFIIYS
jgi:hypothetical protein